MFADNIRSLLKDPRLEGVDIDSAELLEVHREILMEKRLMREVFAEFYRTCINLSEKHFTSSDGMQLEIGAGVSLFKDYFPQITSTDIKPSPHLDRVLDAQAMDLPDNSVRAVYGINCFHHLPEPRKFFGELERVLAPGGGCVLIEPYYGPFAGVLYRNLHDQEHFNKRQSTWEDTAGMKAMSGANQALSYIVFIRDREQYKQEFPGLPVIEIIPLNNWLRYLLSGGVNFRQLVPDALIGLIEFFEKVLSPLNRVLSIHYAIVLKKQ